MNSADDTASPKKSTGHGTLWILAAIVLAIAFAFLAPSYAVNLEIGGEIFLRLLKMMVVFVGP